MSKEMITQNSPQTQGPPKCDVSDTVITLRLYPETTAKAAHFLDLALKYAEFETREDIAACQLLAALFRVSTVASLSQLELDSPLIEELHEVLHLYGVGC